MGGKKGKKKSKKKKSTPASTGRAPSKVKTKAQKMATARVAAKKAATTTSSTKSKSTPASTGRAPSKVKTKAQQMASARIASGKTISQVKAANKQSMKDAASKRNESFQAAKKAKADAKKTSGIGPVKSGAQYAKAVSTATNQPTKKTTGIGPYADGAKYAAALKASPPKFKDGTKVAGNYTSPNVTGYGLRPDGVTGPYKTGDVFNTGGKSGKDFKFDGKSFVPVKTAMLGGDNLGSVLGTGAVIGAGLSLPGMIKNAIDAGGRLRENIEKRVNPDGDKVSALGTLGNMALGISPVSAITTRPADSYGYPSQEAVDKAAGITAGGLNIGGGGFTPSNPSGGSTSRAISDRPASSFNFGPTADGNEYARNLSEFGMRFGATPEARGKAYEQSLDPNSFKGLSDGQTFGVGPVASGDAYERGLNTDNKNVENRLRQVRNLGSTLTGGLIPSVRKLTDKEIADRRIKNAEFRKNNLMGRRGGGGGARLPVAPLTPEEILLPEQVAAAQTGPDYQQALPQQTGVDPNRLLQIQNDAYNQQMAQMFNPYNPLTVGGFNPMFRFFGRRGGPRRGAFRKAFRRN